MSPLEVQTVPVDRGLPRNDKCHSNVRYFSFVEVQALQLGGYFGNPCLGSAIYFWIYFGMYFLVYVGVRLAESARGKVSKFS